MSLDGPGPSSSPVSSPPKHTLNNENNPNRPPFRKLLFAILPLVLVLSLFAFYQTSNSEHNRSTNATATASVNATATAFANAIHAPTATANAQASATAGVILTATSGNSDYADPLNDPNNDTTKNAGWDGLDGSNNYCRFGQDGYYVYATSSKQPQPCLASNLSYSDAAITVNMAINSNSSSAGLVFRSQNSGAGSGYFFEISTTLDNTNLQVPSYRISLLNTTAVLQDWMPSSVINAGNTSNTLQVIVNGSDFSFYVNGKFLTKLTDTSYTSGGIGFACFGANNNDNGEAIFSNLKVYPIS